MTKFLKPLKIVSDGTPYGTRVTTHDGIVIPCVEISYSLKVGDDVARVELVTFADLELSASEVEIKEGGENMNPIYETQEPPAPEGDDEGGEGDAGEPGSEA